MLGGRLFFNFSSFVKKMAQNVAKDCSMAQRVQHNALHELYAIEHEAKLRQKVDLESSIESLQKEMQREIAQALKRSENKVKFLIERTLEKHSEHLRHHFNKEKIQEYNRMVKACETARWEYLVHRHSCGFTIRNYELVMELYKLPPLIVE